MKPATPLAKGNTAEIYALKGGILKLFLRDTEDVVTLEANNQRYARELGLPVPEVRELMNREGQPAILMEQMPGETMLDLIEHNPERAGAWLKRSIELQLQIHSLTAPALFPMAGKLEHQIRAANGLTEDQRRRLIQQLNAIGSQSQLCHGDFHVQNLMVHDDAIAIIDWRDATRGDPRLDVCRTYVLYSGVDPAFADLYLSDYCAGSGLERNDVLFWVPVIAAARLAESTSESEARRLLHLVENP